MAKRINFEQVLQALNDGKGVRRDSWKFGYYYQKVDGELVDSEGNYVDYVDLIEDASVDDWCIMKYTTMDELTDKALWYVTRELVFNQLFIKHKGIIYELLKYARSRHALAITDAPYYTIVYENGILLPALRNSLGHSCLEVRFNSQSICVDAIKQYEKQIFEVVELNDLMALMQRVEVDNLNNTPFTRAELEDLYLKMGGKL
mgnify:CR=1 FL=1